MKTKNDKNISVPEVWGGVECSVVRAHYSYYDQLQQSGHLLRDNDLDKIASLGIKKIRYPVVWETVSPVSSEICNFRASETQLNKLKSLDIEPIAGLLHHGSGPSYTSLLDPKFPGLFARYAGTVANKFPWIKYYTPINEPLTTARFSALYGHWYPHHRDNYSFCYAILNQCKAIISAMAEIRKVSPGAKLIQTEDIGKTSSTEKLKYQAEFENNRRWLTFDLLSGKLEEGDDMWNFFLYAGLDRSDLEFFIENKCEPDILGINYYVTSERYLDENTTLYPEQCTGGNGRDVYADIETVRSSRELHGIETILREVHERYGRKIAVTEVHLGCTREEQLRWFNEIWTAAVKLRKEKIDIEAVTAWSLLGAYDWCSLMTEKNNSYEAGAFDIRNGDLRPTAIAAMLRELSEKECYYHPLLENPGWWKRPIRKIYEPGEKDKPERITYGRPVLIVGAAGTLGAAFSRICGLRGIYHISVSRKEADITIRESVRNIIEKYDPWAVINTAGYVNVDAAENNVSECYLSNTVGAEVLSEICREYNVKLVSFSSDLVFNGQKSNPYIEHDEVAPINVYGMSKAAAEKKILGINSNALVIRTSAFFGPWDKYNFVYNLLNHSSENKSYKVSDDIYISPTYVPDLVNETLDLLIDDEKGIWHITNEGEISWTDFAYTAAEIFNINNTFIKPVNSADIGFKAKRPPYSVLQSNKGIKLNPFYEALQRYKDEADLLTKELL